uniref:RRM domain-containing protein n=1 Tax=Timema douglasi TaxID=61478 RepID=A0A7R8ZDD6_TIMDO|nr:unnamed protein product [Timema douglasi]
MRRKSERVKDKDKEKEKPSEKRHDKSSKHSRRHSRRRRKSSSSSPERDESSKENDLSAKGSNSPGAGETSKQADQLAVVKKNTDDDWKEDKSFWEDADGAENPLVSDFTLALDWTADNREIEIRLWLDTLKVEGSEQKHSKDKDSKSSVWQVKTADSGGESNKLKICIVRPQDLPAEQPSPHRRKRLSRTSSSSQQSHKDEVEEETTKSEASHEKKKSHSSDDRRRSKRSKEEKKKSRDSSEETEPPQNSVKPLDEPIIINIELEEDIPLPAEPQKIIIDEKKELASIEIPQEEEIKREETLRRKSSDEESIRRKSLYENTLQEKSLDKESIQTKSLNEDMIQTKSLDKETVQTKSLDVEMIHTKPLAEEMIQTKSLDEEVVQTKSLDKEVVQTKSLGEEVVQTKSLDEEIVQTKSSDEAVTQRKSLDEEVIQRKSSDKESKLQDLQMEVTSNADKVKSKEEATSLVKEQDESKNEDKSTGGTISSSEESTKQKDYFVPVSVETGSIEEIQSQEVQLEETTKEKIPVEDKKLRDSSEGEKSDSSEERVKKVDSDDSSEDENLKKKRDSSQGIEENYTVDKKHKKRESSEERDSSEERVKVSNTQKDRSRRSSSEKHRRSSTSSLEKSKENSTSEENSSEESDSGEERKVRKSLIHRVQKRNSINEDKKRLSSEERLKRGSFSSNRDSSDERLVSKESLLKEKVEDTPNNQENNTDSRRKRLSRDLLGKKAEVEKLHKIEERMDEGSTEVDKRQRSSSHTPPPPSRPRERVLLRRSFSSKTERQTTEETVFEKTGQDEEKEEKENDAKSNIEEGEIVSLSPRPMMRKRRWGASKLRTAKKPVLAISTDSLKNLIPDVKPVSLTEVQLSRDEEVNEVERVRDDPEDKHHQITEVIVVERTREGPMEKPLLPPALAPTTELPPLKNSADHKVKMVTRKISLVSDGTRNLQSSPSPPRHKSSSVLFISNLVRPFTINQLKELLARTGTIVEGGFWIDKIKSRCYVEYSRETEAKETRHALHGVRWPVSNPKQLCVDFGKKEDMEMAQTLADTEQIPRKTEPLKMVVDHSVEGWLVEQAREREQRDREREQRDRERARAKERAPPLPHPGPIEPLERNRAVKAPPVVREWDIGKLEHGPSPVERDFRHEERGREREKRVKEKRPHRSRTPSPHEPPVRKGKKKEEDAPAKLLDDLFRKTKCTPCIYWLPLTAEQIVVKEEMRRRHMAEHERRMAEMKKVERERERARIIQQQQRRVTTTREKEKHKKRSVSGSSKK